MRLLLSSLLLICHINLQDAFIIQSTNSRSTNSCNAVRGDTNNLERTTDKAYRKRPNRYKPQYTKLDKATSNSIDNVIQLFKQAKSLEQKRLYTSALSQYEYIIRNVTDTDSHTHLALARLTQKVHHNDPDAIRHIYERGISKCPKCVHLYQSYALYLANSSNRNNEKKRAAVEQARELLNTALDLDPRNIHVYHAYGQIEASMNNCVDAEDLYTKGLSIRGTAALICSLGELLARQGRYDDARVLYESYCFKYNNNTITNQITTKPTNYLSEREHTEVYMALSWLLERDLQQSESAIEVLEKCLDQYPLNTRVIMALIKLEDRRSNSNKKGSIKLRERLESLCESQLSDEKLKKMRDGGRLFNAWAKQEIEGGDLTKARGILSRAVELFPHDLYVMQAAGKLEERFGEYDRAREYYRKSLDIQATAPALVAYALLESKHPPVNSTTIGQDLFEEALLVDPRHGPAYNAYGAVQLRQKNVEAARNIFERGIAANCIDIASVYHGYAKLELKCGNVDKARSLLRDGMKKISAHDAVATIQRNRAVFLFHTLGMLELNGHSVTDAQEVFRQGMRRYGNSSQLLLGAALCEVRLGNDGEARVLFEKSVNLDERHAHAWQAWGVMEMRNGNYTVAKTLFDCGLRKTPQHGALWQAYGIMESRRGNTEVARQIFTSGLERCPNHTPIYQAWAYLELREKNHDQARRLVEEALTKNKKDGTSWLIAARIEEQLGNMGLTNLLLRRGIELDPNDPDLYAALADLEWNQGKILSARSLLEKAIEKDPFNAPLYHSLAELEASIGNIGGLAKLNEQAEQIFTRNPSVVSPASNLAWVKKLQQKQSRTLPEGIAALAQRIGDRTEDDFINIDQTITEADPNEMAEQMGQFEDEVIEDILNIKRMMEDDRN